MTAPDRKDQYIPDHAQDIDDELPDQAEDAIEEMEARERRRDSSYRSGGDDLNPGIDTDMNSNAPKDDALPNKKGGGSRGKSDWN